MENRKPKTIEELKAFCAEMGMPLEKMRFFIGEDNREARAFGIYRDDYEDMFVVYKNKADGSRSVRYHGPDEAYAVNEIYEKLKSEVELRRSAREAATTDKRAARGILALLTACIVLCIVAVAFVIISHGDHPRGYYQYESETYYFDNHDWYVFSDMLDEWTPWEEVADWTEEPKEYYLSSGYSDSYGADDFRNSEYYDDSKDSFDWGSGSDFDSWDSGATDWSSDW